MTEIKLGDQVQVKIESEEWGLTLVTGNVVGLGYIKNKPDHYWFSIAGLSNTFYSDEITSVKSL